MAERGEYDHAVEVWRDATRKLLRAGSDSPDRTADDVRDMLENMIEEENEDGSI